MKEKCRRVQTGAGYCAPESALAQNAKGYRNWMSASRLALTLISAVVAREYGSTKISTPIHCHLMFAVGMNVNVHQRAVRQ